MDTTFYHLLKLQLSPFSACPYNTYNSVTLIDFALQSLSCVPVEDCPDSGEYSTYDSCEGKMSEQQSILALGSLGECQCCNSLSNDLSASSWSCDSPQSSKRGGCRRISQGVRLISLLSKIGTMRSLQTEHRLPY